VRQKADLGGFDNIESTWLDARSVGMLGNVHGSGSVALLGGQLGKVKGLSLAAKNGC